MNTQQDDDDEDFWCREAQREQDIINSALREYRRCYTLLLQAKSGILGSECRDDDDYYDNECESIWWQIDGLANPYPLVKKVCREVEAQFREQYGKEPPVVF